ncbi:MULTISPECIES: hypothetical protein [Acidiplasma]|jgi:hypothetical protein|nr:MULTISPECIES: hypothetical protein [Acidiplasma]WMT55750.1 MAG: hypothetical protein RE470_03650 [Acidiplasma sp.]
MNGYTINAVYDNIYLIRHAFPWKLEAPIFKMVENATNLIDN